MDISKFIEYITDKYNINYDFSQINISPLEQYPHILKMESPNDNIIIKILQNKKMQSESLNRLYSNLSQIKYTKTPRLTKDNNYSLPIGNKIVLLYDELEEIKNEPSPIWWSNCLSDIHNLNQNDDFIRYYPDDFYTQTINILCQAEKIMPAEIKSKLYYLLRKVNRSLIDRKPNMILCHNDPYNLNVMSSKHGYKLIDTDGAGLSPREYDIQRLLYNYVINKSNINEIIDFWSLFRENYEKKTSTSINIKLLKNIYILDLIRTVSWLYKVTNDSTRLDRNRQQNQLNLFEQSLNNNSHIKVLKNIK